MYKRKTRVDNYYSFLAFLSLGFLIGRIGIRWFERLLWVTIVTIIVILLY